MNEEKITHANASAAGKDANKENESKQDKSTDDYYSVDDPKNPVYTNIGNGEMHNEGLVGEGNIDDNGTFSEGTTNEQDEADNHDSEG